MECVLSSTGFGMELGSKPRGVIHLLWDLGQVSNFLSLSFLLYRVENRIRLFLFIIIGA